MFTNNLMLDLQTKQISCADVSTKKVYTEDTTSYRKHKRSTIDYFLQKNKSLNPNHQEWAKGIIKRINSPTITNGKLDQIYQEVREEIHKRR